MKNQTKKAKNNYFTARRCRRWLEAFYQKDIFALSGSQPIFLLPSLSTVSQSYINSCISRQRRKKNKHYFTVYSHITAAAAAAAASQNGPELCSWSGTRATLSPRSRCWLAHLCIRGKKVHASAVAHFMLFENYERERGNNWDKTNCTQKIMPRSKKEISV